MLNWSLSESFTSEFHCLDLENVIWEKQSRGGGEWGNGESKKIPDSGRCSPVNGVDCEQAAVVHDDKMGLCACLCPSCFAYFMPLNYLNGPERCIKLLPSNPMESA